MTTPWWQGGTPSTGGGSSDGRDSQFVHVEDYGALGDGTTDDAAAIQAAIVAALALDRILVFQARNYRVNTGIVVGGSAPLDIRGIRVGSQVTTLTAGASMSAVLSIAGTHQLSDIVFDANFLATRAVSCNNSSAFTQFTHCDANNAIRDGFWIGDTGINDSLTFHECWARGNGRYQRTSGAPSASGYLYAGQQLTVAGTVSTTSGSAVITGSGTTFTAMGLLPMDVIQIGTSGNVELAEILSVDSDTQITCCRDNFATTRNTQQYGTLSGCGYAEMRHSDANINKVFGGLWRSNAVAGLSVRGLYGSKLNGCQTDTNGAFGIALGNPLTGDPVYYPTIENCYFESNGIATEVGAAIRLSSVRGASIHSGNMFYGTPTIISYGGLTSQISGTLMVYDEPTEISSLGNLNSLISSIPVSRAARQGFKLTGPLVAYFSNISSVAGAALALDTLDTGASDLQWYFDTAADKLITAAPSITGGVEDSLIRITNFNATYSATLQDESVLSGSKLKLTSARRVLLPGESITLYKHTGFYWEVGGTRDYRPADSTASPGAATQDKRVGRVAIAIGAASVVVTNKLVTSSSVITAVLQSNDATLTQLLRVVPGSGSFTITGNGNATAATNVAWSLET